MADTQKPTQEKLKNLIKLLDDDSQETQEALRREFLSFGANLQQSLDDLPEKPTKDERRMIAQLLRISSSEVAPLDKTLFTPGQLVKHKKYGYRGVVADLDLSCKATDSWYETNKTKPDRDQPWYHVLVHASDKVTYAAQTSLEADDCGRQIKHPLEKAFFSDFKDGRYIRNERPWPDGSD